MAEMKYNPPPNWPTPPEGFSPEPGWEPDPAWGPAPHGWPLWVEAVPAKPRGGSNLGRIVLLAGVALLIVAIVLAAVQNHSGGKKPAAASSPGSSVTTPASADSSTTDAPVVAYVPTKADFAIKLKITKKDCFGSAGCNVEFHIVPSYSGQPFTGTYQITYKVSGDSDGPQVDSFTIDDDGTATYDEDELASTASSHTVLKATVTDVEAQ